MRKMRKSLIMCTLCLLTLLFSGIAASAAVTTQHVNGEPDKAMIVAGNNDFYPVEYYNTKTKQYDGVMPEILKTISEETGIDFIYVRDSATPNELIKSDRADMVSAHVTDSVTPFIGEKINVFSYTQRGVTVHIGFAFHENTDPATIEKIRTAVDKIPDEEINGYLVSTRFEKPEDKTGYIVMGVCNVLLGILILCMAIIKSRSTRKLMEENKLTDGDTGIGNLAYFESRYHSAILHRQDRTYYAAYIIIDSNYLQVYYGAATFSDALKYAAGVLKSAESDNGIAARITENGFVYAFHCNDEEKARTHMEELLRRLNISTEEENKSRTPMFHAAVYRLTPEDTSCELLLFNLRRNCTKTIGTETKLTFLSDKDMNRASEEKKLIDAFRDGFANQEFKLYLQFIVENETKQIISAEALSRWEHPERGLLAPGAYISAMESTGEITNLDYYMFETVCRRLHKWKDTEFGNISISCNFTRITLSEENFARRLEEIASGYVFNRSKLIIEITEDVIEQDRDRATDNVRACKKMGFRVALDDLGSGYTSLSNLCDYPIDIVKIDRDIMLKTNRKNGKELFSGIIALAHSMNLKVVCEGVETEQHNAFVSASDCDYVQGWYYSRVHPATEAESFIRTYRENLK